MSAILSVSLGRGPVPSQQRSRTSRGSPFFDDTANQRTAESAMSVQVFRAPAPVTTPYAKTMQLRSERIEDHACKVD